MADRRNFQRIKFSTTSMLKVGDSPYQGDLLDISLNGALLRFDTLPPVHRGEICDLEIRLPASEISMNFKVELVHSDDGNEYGLKFISQDIETITHLRRLVELNMGDSEEFNREFSHWLKT
ncbi:MAG: PilZ domain-containing protein [Desulfobacterales bacterium]|nr:PilZ domain-containing protein [Desulfobacterales bacterium]